MSCHFILFAQGLEKLMPMLALKCSVNVSVGFLPFFALYNALLSAKFCLLMPSHGTTLAANNDLTKIFYRICCKSCKKKHT